MDNEKKEKEQEGDSTQIMVESKCINICTTCLAMNVHRQEKCHYCCQGNCQMMGLLEHSLFRIEFFEDQAKSDKFLEIKDRRNNRSFVYKIKDKDNKEDKLYYFRPKGWPILSEEDPNIIWKKEVNDNVRLFCTECGHPWRIKSCVDPKCKSTQNRYEIFG